MSVWFYLGGLRYVDGCCWQGKLRGKKLQSLVDKISFQSNLGPYSGGSYTSSSGLSVKLRLVSLSQLQSGVNSERVVVGRVVCSVCMESSIALYVTVSFQFVCFATLFGPRQL